MTSLKGWNRNEWLGFLNGCGVSIGDGFMSVTVVMAGFAARLGAPNWVIGLLPAIAGGGWMLPQLLVAARVRPLAYKLPIYRSAAFVRTSMYIIMVLVTAFLEDVLARVPLQSVVKYIEGIIAEKVGAA